VAEERAVLTADRDHLALADAWTEAGLPHAGVIYYHSGWTSLGHIVREVHDLARALTAGQARSRVFYISRDRGPR